MAQGRVSSQLRFQPRWVEYLSVHLHHDIAHITLTEHTTHDRGVGHIDIQSIIGTHGTGLWFDYTNNSCRDTAQKYDLPNRTAHHH